MASPAAIYWEVAAAVASDLGETGRVMSANYNKLVTPIEDMRISVENLLDGGFGHLGGDAREGVKRIYNSSVALYTLIMDIITELGVENVCTRATLQAKYDGYIQEIVANSRTLLDGVDGPLNDEQEMAVSFLYDGARLLERQAKMMFNYSYIVHKLYNARREPVQLASFITPALFSDYETDLACSVQLDNDLPPVPVDPVLLRRALDYVIDNAIRYTSTGTVQLTVRRTYYGVDVAVKDSGKGITTEMQERVFEPFFQVNDWEDGIGLGLTIARALIELQNGTVRLQSTYNIGTTVTFALPISGR